MEKRGGERKDGNEMDSKEVRRKNENGTGTQQIIWGDGILCALAKFLQAPMRRMRSTESETTWSKSDVSSKTAVCIPDSNSGSSVKQV